MPRARPRQPCRQSEARLRLRLPPRTCQRLAPDRELYSRSISLLSRSPTLANEVLELAPAMKIGALLSPPLIIMDAISLPVPDSSRTLMDTNGASPANVEEDSAAIIVKLFGVMTVDGPRGESISVILLARTSLGCDELNCPPAYPAEAATAIMRIFSFMAQQYHGHSADIYCKRQAARIIPLLCSSGFQRDYDL